MIPPRPNRTSGESAAPKQDIPIIPPRPMRKTDPSPDREAYTRSPFNVLPSTNGNGSRFPPPSKAPTASTNNGLRRPPSINFPSEVGQEGSEYTSYDQLPAEAHGVSKSTATADPTAAAAIEQETRNVSADIPLHQPKASVPLSTAKSRIATVTRTDSTQAAAAGIGKARPDDDVHKTPGGGDVPGSPLSRVTSRTYGGEALGRVPSAELHPLRAKASFNRSSSSLHNGRPSSVHSDHHHEGIPEIGQQIPLYPNAGDVQAPTPGPGSSQHTPGIGFFNDGSARAHHRKRSSRHEFGPPGSYGLHGHGTEPQDQFERAWLAKHPEAQKEGLSPYMHRPESALSSEQLNKLVREDNDVGMGESPLRNSDEVLKRIHTTNPAI